MVIVLLALAVFVTDAAAVRAQQNTIAGTVLSATTLSPLEGAQVTVEGTALRATTTANGRFRLQGVPEGQATVRVTRIGYRPVTQVVAVSGRADVRVLLATAPVELDEVVVTGTTGETQRRALGNSVVVIDAVAARELGASPTLTNLINGRAPGVVVTPGNGQVGSGPAISIRGVTTFLPMGGNQPLLYIDGVRVNNQTASGTDNQGGAIVSRLNDINPEDIESIEIIKGPAAATIYGTEASNGVIQVITKRGRQRERVQYTATVRQGANWFMNADERFPNAFWRDPETGVVTEWDPVKQEKNRETPIWRTGHDQSYVVTASGGRGGITFYLSGATDQQQGIDPLNYLRRYTAHLNLGFAPSERLDVKSNVNITKGRIGIGLDGGDSPWFSALFSPGPAVTPPQNRGFFIAPPEAYYSGVYENTQHLTRFTGSVELNHRPLTWFSQRLLLGLDQTGEDNITLTRFMPPEVAQFYDDQWAKGSVVDDQRNIAQHTVDYRASAQWSLPHNLAATTSIGVQFTRKRTDVNRTTGEGFPGPGVETVGAAAITDGTQSTVTSTTLGSYVQEQLAWRNRLFLTGAVRVDNNSAFGEDVTFAVYPKVQASWVISEEPFWRYAFVNTLKLRSAFGLAGLPPAGSSALRTYSATTGPDNAPALTPRNMGNPDLRPERGRETEFGFEAGLFDRIGIDFTYFYRKSTDQLIERPQAPSRGFPGQQFVNAGSTTSHGMELQVIGQLVNRRRIGVDVTLNVGTVSSEITSLGGLTPFSIAVGQFNKVGYPIASYFGKRLVSATYDATTKQAENLLCDDGADGAVACATAPEVFLGSVTPKVNGAYSMTVTLFRRLRLYGMVDFKVGHRLFDSDGPNGFLRCHFSQNCEVVANPDKFSALDVAQAQTSDPTIRSGYVRDASFAKLRELSASYVLPERWVRKAGTSAATLTIAGRNLHTWTRWPGLDPESRILPASTLGTQQANTPQLAQFVTTLSLTF